MQLVDTGELEAFLALAEELHFGRTAQHLGLSPQRISQLIQALERRLGGRLFDRTSRRVTLSDLGRQLHAEVSSHYDGVRAALLHARETARASADVLRIGAMSAVWMRLFLQAVDRLEHRNPAAHIDIREVAPPDACALLLRREVDVINISFPVTEPGIATTRPLLREGRVLAVAATNALSARTEIGLKDLASVRMLSVPGMPEAWIRDRTQTSSPHSPGPAARSVHEALALISADTGAFVFGAQMLDHYRSPDITYLPITDAPPLEWGLAWRENDPPPLLQPLLKTVTSLAPILSQRR
ncbi:LysR family transcriptional regulator [Nocardia terrae]|uniref:LysR family transcriptional regulator n=1 Tax=Nocardia terrae TaxID=2675851 RepID=UPI0018DF0EC5|nr:LysR family transcriptional regulator [Nocardia terrae]